MWGARIPRRGRGSTPKPWWRLPPKKTVRESAAFGSPPCRGPRRSDSTALSWKRSNHHTDGSEAYQGLGAIGYQHRPTVLARQKAKNAASPLLPRVHRVASLLKWWLLGTHQGAVSAEHLDYYLDEFTFRFNRRTSRSRGKLFYRLLQQAVQVPPNPHRGLIGGRSDGE